MSPADVGAPLEALGHGARLLADAPADWATVLVGARRVPACYTRALLGYQARYVRDAVDAYEDRSVVLYHDGRPAAVWPLSLARRGDVWAVGSQEASVRLPLFAATVPERTQKKMSASCLEFVQQTARALSAPCFKLTEPCTGDPLGPLHRGAVELGAAIQVRHGLYVDLRLDLADIRARIRERYRSLINRASSLWNVDVVEGAAPEVFEEFRLLHLAVAGRATRSLATWELQRDALATGDAFLVTLRDPSGRLVGGGLFHLSRTDGLYAVGAYDRSLFDAPVSHAVQWKAIETMKRRGLLWYFIGLRPYPRDEPAPTPKELQLGHFKEGFATHVYPELELTISLGEPRPEQPSGDGEHR